MLGIVEQQQRRLALHCFDERLHRLDLRPLRYAQRLPGRKGDDRGIAQRRKRDPSDPVWKRLGHFGSRLQRQPRLARAARPAERQQPHLVATQQLNDACQLVRATQKRRRRNREVRPIQALQRREVTLPQLVHTLRRSQILETVLPEVAKLRADDQRSRRRRHKHLTPVTGCRDPRRTVHVDAHVPLLG